MIQLKINKQVDEGQDVDWNEDCCKLYTGIFKYGNIEYNILEVEPRT